MSSLSNPIFGRSYVGPWLNFNGNYFGLVVLDFGAAGGFSRLSMPWAPKPAPVSLPIPIVSQEA